jgi:hypothetical protein
MSVRCLKRALWAPSGKALELLGKLEEQPNVSEIVSLLAASDSPISAVSDL